MSTNNKNSGSASGGMGFMSVLQLILIAFKVAGVITCSWWKVLIPTWIVIGCIVIAAVIIAIVKR